MKSSRLPRTAALFALVFLAGPSVMVGAEPSTVRGSISFDRDGDPQITDCETHRLISLGPKTSASYTKFAQTYRDLSRDWDGHSVVEVEGELSRRRGPNKELVFITSTVSRFRHGACESTPRPVNDAPALARLLSELRKKLDLYRSVPDSNLPFNDDSELAILIGATKKEIRAGLGAPEYCSESRHLEDDCPNSREWAYFFFHREPLTFGGGCCALELEFNARSKVKLVKWQAQR